MNAVVVWFSFPLQKKAPPALMAQRGGNARRGEMPRRRVGRHHARLVRMRRDDAHSGHFDAAARAMCGKKLRTVSSPGLVVLPPRIFISVDSFVSDQADRSTSCLGFSASSCALMSDVAGSFMPQC